MVHPGADAVRIKNAVVDQCAGEITRDIIAGVYKPGDKLPPVARLAQVYGVPRLVMEQALQALCRENALCPAKNPPDGRQRFTVAEESPAGEPDVLQEKYLTVTEVAAALRVSNMTVYRLVHDREIASKRIGRAFRVPERAVRDFLRRCEP